MPLVVADLVGVLRADASNWNMAMGDAQRSMQTLGSSVERQSQGLSRTLQSVSVAAAAIGSAFAVQATQVVQGSLQMNAMLEKTELQFATLLKSSMLAHQEVASLFQFAKETPFETGPVIQAARMLRTVGGASLDTADNLRMVGDAAAGASADIGNVAMYVGRAYNAIMAGKPFGEAAMRLQELGLMGGDARNKIDALQKAGADSATVWKVVTDELGKYGGAMEKQAHTMEGLRSTLSDTVHLMSASVLAPLYEGEKKLFTIVTDLANSPGMANLSNLLKDTVANAIQPFDSGLAHLDEMAKNFDASKLLASVRHIKDEFGGLIAIGGGAAAGGAFSFLHNIPVIGQLLPDIAGPTGVMVGALVGLIAKSAEARDAVMDLAGHLSDIAGREGPGFAHVVDEIGDAVAGVVPPMADLIETVADMAVGIGQKLAPAAGIVVPVLHLLGDTLQFVADHKTIVEGLFAVFVVFEATKTAVRIAQSIQGLGETLITFAARMGEAGAAVTSFEVAAGGIGIVIGLATAAYLLFSGRHKDVVQTSADLVDALVKEKGAWDADTLAVLGNVVAKDKDYQDHLKDLNTIGITTDAILKGAQGEAASRQVATDKLKAYNDETDRMTQGFISANTAAGKYGITGELSGQIGALTDAQYKVIESRQEASDGATELIKHIFGIGDASVDTANKVIAANTATDQATKDMDATFSHFVPTAQALGASFGGLVPKVDDLAAAEAAAEDDAKALKKAQDEMAKTMEDYSKKATAVIDGTKGMSATWLDGKSAVKTADDALQAYMYTQGLQLNLADKQTGAIERLTSLAGGKYAPLTDQLINLPQTAENLQMIEQLIKDAVENPDVPNFADKLLEDMGTKGNIATRGAELAERAGIPAAMLEVGNIGSDAMAKGLALSPAQFSHIIDQWNASFNQVAPDGVRFIVNASMHAVAGSSNTYDARSGVLDNDIANGPDPRDIARQQADFFGDQYATDLKSKGPTGGWDMVTAADQAWPGIAKSMYPTADAGPDPEAAAAAAGGGAPVIDAAGVSQAFVSIANSLAAPNQSIIDANSVSNAFTAISNHMATSGMPDYGAIASEDKGSAPVVGEMHFHEKVDPKEVSAEIAWAQGKSR